MISLSSPVTRDQAPLATGRTSRCMILAMAVLSFVAAAAIAQEDTSWSSEVWGTIGFENRLFLNPPAYPGQKRNDISATIKPTFLFEHEDGSSFTLTPYLRFDGTDSERTHIDIREAYYLRYGSLGESEWELRLGIDQVFWGTAESVNLVNIVNQTDHVEHPDGKEKLGQPMIQGTLSGDWGVLNLLVLPYHRPRTFPGKSGRLRAQLPISYSGSDIIYEDPAGKRHIDLAVRYSNSIGPLDFGISMFEGTSREPYPTICRLTSCTNPNPNQLNQYYYQSRQIGLDLQLTTDALIGKAEAVWQKSILPGQEPLLLLEELKVQELKKKTHTAYVVGVEYPIYGVFDSDADLTLFAEWIQDSRRSGATTPLQNDLFLAARYMFNDFGDTSIGVAVTDDLDYRTRSLNAEFKHRLNDSVSLEIEGFKFLRNDQRELTTWPVREDGYLAATILYSF